MMEMLAEWKPTHNWEGELMTVRNSSNCTRLCKTVAHSSAVDTWQYPPGHSARHLVSTRHSGHLDMDNIGDVSDSSNTMVISVTSNTKLPTDMSKSKGCCSLITLQSVDIF